MLNINRTESSAIALDFVLHKNEKINSKINAKKIKSIIADFYQDFKLDNMKNDETKGKRYI